MFLLEKMNPVHERFYKQYDSLLIEVHLLNHATSRSFPHYEYFFSILTHVIKKYVVCLTKNTAYISKFTGAGKLLFSKIITMINFILMFSESRYSTNGERNFSMHLQRLR